mgnify:FL=1
MKLLLTALVLMMLHGCSEDDTYVVATGDVTIEDSQTDASDEVSDADVIDSVEDVSTLDVEITEEVSVEEDADEAENVDQLDEDPTSFEQSSDPASQFFHPQIP